MIFYVYVLFSLKDKHFYIGYTNDLKRRIKQHLSGKTKSLRHRKELKLIYFEGFLNKKDALEKEKFYKSGRGHEVLNKILKNSLLQLNSGHGGSSESEDQMSVRL
ncbi:MAG: GIY-YIG nuclease family protein [Microgenomates group bacterium]